jgi:hypothetical protein
MPTPAGEHVFGRRRPSESGAPRLHKKARRDTHFRPLPAPTGKFPFHLDLADILSAKDHADIVKKRKLTFHLNGDMGGISDSQPQLLVARGMEQDFRAGAAASNNPAFLYILGDCVYFNGEAKEYYAQFYHPYEFYPAPVFAVPGNHDGENLPEGSTLDGFVRNFCAHGPKKLPESGDSGRTAMNQPNVYWTLRTPLASFVGLYSNVPEGGDIRAPQSTWLVQQLKTLPRDRPLLLSLHHPLYSADDFHSGSTYMKELLANSVAAAGGRHPEMVLAGHVHNYQRLTRALPGQKQLPFLVSGAGGYHNLHNIRKVDGEKMVAPVVFEDNDGERVTLERYADDRHGFGRLEITDKLIIGRYYTVPRPQEPYSKGNQLADYFEFDWKKRRYLPNTLG